MGRGGIKARRYEERIETGVAGKITKECWQEKVGYGWKDDYGRKRERYYNRNEWGIETLEVRNGGGEDTKVELISKEEDTQRQYEEGRILKVKYNKKYKEVILNDGPSNLRKENLEEISREDEMRDLIKLRCGNVEQENKYWLRENYRVCLFCGKGKDCLEHYVRECQDIKEWFVELGMDEKEIINLIWGNELDKTKGRILRKLWKERERELRKENNDRGSKKERERKKED